jgi:nitric oxide reductase NorQ protein
VIEEADRAHPSLLSALNCLTDDSGHPLTMPDGRILPVGPGFRVVLTWNPGAQYGGRGMNAALKDRLLPIYCDYPDSATETKALVARCGIGPVRANDIRKVAESIRALAGTTGFDLSLRALVTWADLLMRGVCPTWMRAFEVAILDLCASPTEDPATREALLNVAKSAGVESWR